MLLLQNKRSNVKASPKLYFSLLVTGANFIRYHLVTNSVFLFLFYLIMFSKFSATLLLVQNNFCKAYTNLPSVNSFCFELTQLELEKQDCHQINFKDIFSRYVSFNLTRWLNLFTRQCQCIRYVFTPIFSETMNISSVLSLIQRFLICFCFPFRLFERKK